MNEPMTEASGGDWVVEAEGKPFLNLSVVVSVRFDRGDAALLRHAARKHRMTLSEFVRRAVARATDDALGTRGAL